MPLVINYNWNGPLSHFMFIQLSGAGCFFMQTFKTKISTREARSETPCPVYTLPAPDPISNYLKKQQRHQTLLEAPVPRNRVKNKSKDEQGFTETGAPAGAAIAQRNNKNCIIYLMIVLLVGSAHQSFSFLLGKMFFTELNAKWLELRGMLCQEVGGWALGFQTNGWRFTSPYQLNTDMNHMSINCQHQPK